MIVGSSQGRQWPALAGAHRFGMTGRKLSFALALTVVVAVGNVNGGYYPTSWGWTALAATGEEAMTLLKGRNVTYRALVTDINLLGRFNGWEVARAAREVDPAFPVIYMSGAAVEQWPIQGVPHSIVLQKPFAPA